MRAAVLMGLVAFAASVIGCASRPKYTLEEHNIWMSAQRVPLRVGVAVFTDARPPEERTAKARLQVIGAEHEEELDSYTYDDDFVDGKVAEPLTEMTAKHLEAGKVFEKATVVAIPSDQITPERAKNGEFKEYDAILVGEMTHMWGYMYKSVMRQLLFLPMGGTGLTLNTVIPAPIKGHTALSRVKLISTHDGRVIWEGDVEAKIETDKMFNNTKRMTAMALWRNMINDLAIKIEATRPILKP